MVIGHCVALLAVLLLTTPAAAHPLGNGSINHITILWILPDRVEFDLFLDFAEEPSQRYPEQIDADSDGQETAEEQKGWLKKRAAKYVPLLTVTLDGRPLPLTAADQAYDPKTGKKMSGIPGLIKIPGVAGMPTYKTLTRYVGRYPGPLSAGQHVLNYEDATFGPYTGLKRILLEQVPAIEVLEPHPEFLDPEGTAFLYDRYDPANLPNERRATIRFRVAEGSGPSAEGSGLPASRNASAWQAGAQGSGLQGKARGSLGDQAASRPADLAEQTPTYLATITDPRNDPAKTSQPNRQARQLVGLLQGRWGLMVFLTVTALSFIWGAAHALMPGHAKTVVAAYLISRSGNYWHAVVLAVIVTITHTALVVVVGLVIWFYQTSHPALGARLQLWLGIIAGVLVAAMGVTLVWRALTGRIAHHHHDHNHVHDAEPRSWARRLLTHSHPHLPEAEGERGRGGETGTEGRRDGRTEGHHHEQGHSHAHHHGHTRHHHHGHGHSSGHDHAPAIQSEIRNPKSEIDTQPLTLRMLMLLGITGGIVPCPTATIILLLGIGANVVTGALYAVGIFSLGLALTLMLIGFMALSSRRIAARILSDTRHEGELSTTGRRILLQAVPALSGALVVALGVAIAANYLYHLHNGRALFAWLG